VFTSFAIALQYSGHFGHSSFGNSHKSDGEIFHIQYPAGFPHEKPRCFFFFTFMFGLKRVVDRNSHFFRLDRSPPDHLRRSAPEHLRSLSKQCLRTTNLRAGKLLLRARSRGSSRCLPPGQVWTEIWSSEAHTTNISQDPARSPSARIPRPSPLSLTVWIHYLFQFWRCLSNRKHDEHNEQWLTFGKEVDRAIDNLVKSGKLWNAPRRDSMPMMMGRPYPDYGMLRVQMARRTRF
jgi:hypothetical protein